MSKKNNGIPKKLDINVGDLLATIYEIQDKPEVLSLIYDLVTKLKKIKDREEFYKTCEFSPKLSSALENLIKVIDHEEEKARKKEEKRGKYTIKKKYAHAFREYGQFAAAEVNEAVRQMRELNVEAQARLSEPKLYVGTTNDIEPTEKKSQDKSDEKTKQRHSQLTQLKAALAALYALNERQHQIMKLKLALQAVLELQTETEQTSVKKGMTREELKKIKNNKRF